MSRAFLVLLIPILYLLFMAKIFSIFIADVYFVQSKIYLEEMDFEKSQISIKKAIQANKKEPAYYRHSAKVLLARKVVSSGDEAVTMRDMAEQEIEKAIALNTKNLATIRNSLPLYYHMHIEEDADFRQKTKNFFSNLKMKYANDVGVLVDLADNERKLGFSNEFEVTKEMVYKLRPDLLEWHDTFK